MIAKGAEYSNCIPSLTYIHFCTYSYREVNNNIQYLKFCTCAENYWKYSLNSKTSLIDCINK